MKDLTHYLITRIVDNPDSVVIDEERNGDSSIQLTVHVDKNDMGRVIGKEGKTIHAIRDVVKILAVKQNVHVDIELAEE